MAAATVMSDQQRQAAVERLQAAQQAQPAQPVVAAAPAVAQMPADMIGKGVQLAGPVVPGVVPAAASAAPAPVALPPNLTPIAPISLNDAARDAKGNLLPGASAAAPTPEAVAAGAVALTTPAAEAAWIREANAAEGDFNKMLDIAARYPESRRAIQDQLRISFDNQSKLDETKKIMEAAARGDPKAMNKLELALRPSSGKQKEKEEITTKDYLQAILYKRLGLDDLAADVQRKIMGTNVKFGQLDLDGTKWIAEYNPKTGELLRATDNEGNAATENTLNKLRSSAIPISTATPPVSGATRVRDSQGTEWSVVPSARGSMFFDNNNKQGVPQGRTVPIAVGSDLELAQARQDIETVAKFGNMTAEARLGSFANTNKLRADRGLPLLSLAEMGLNADGSMIGEATRRPGTVVTPAAPAAPAAVPPPAPVAVPAVDTAAVARAQNDLAAIDREIKRVPPRETARLQVLNQERAAIQQRLTQASGATTGGGAAVTGGAIPSAAQMATQEAQAASQRKIAEEAAIAENKLKNAISEKQQTQPIDVGTAEQKDFVTYKTTVQDKAEAGREVSKVTRTQVKDLMQDPAIIGIMNGSGTQYAAAGKLLREMAAGAYSEDESGKRLADDIRGLSISQPQKDALSRYAQLNTNINRATLKANTGGGAISNAEQAANKAANMTNIGDLTPFAALSGLSRRAFQGDLSQEKAAMLADRKYVTRDQFDQAWQRTEDIRVQQYDGIYRARLELIKPFSDKANANPNDAQAQQRYRDAAIHAFRVYPNMEYTAGSGWSFRTPESKRASMAAAAGDR
jgi:hypothetical protein